jgi:hypothetical protein
MIGWKMKQVTKCQLEQILKKVQGLDSIHNFPWKEKECHLIIGGWLLRVEVVSRKWGIRKKIVRVHIEHKYSFTYTTQSRAPM